MSLLQKYEESQIQALKETKAVPAFKAGDTVTVSVKVIEGANSRVQDFQGVVIARRNAGLGSTFRVRKVAFGGGIERSFLLYSPNISIRVDRRGKVRRAKLYYLRDRKGKSARIEELR